MCSLADHKDLIPYLPILLPSLQAIITDPIPEVRTVSSKGKFPSNKSWEWKFMISGKM